MSDILALDVGGTNIRIAIIDRHGNVRETSELRTALGERNIDENGIIERLAGLLEDILHMEREIGAIGIGFPGFFVGNSGLLASSPNLPGLRDIPLAERLTERLKLPVAVQNDALCAAIGEHRFGAGKGHNNLLHITLGTGIGGGLILNNAPYSGEGGMAMEFGHLTVDRSDSARRCGCGGKGCVEQYASAEAMVNRYEELTGMRSDARNIFNRAETGESKALAVMNSAGNHLGMAMAEAVKLLDIHTITVSGGVTGAWELLHPAVTAALDEQLIPPLRGRVSVLRTVLADRAGLLGAAQLTL